MRSLKEKDKVRGGRDEGGRGERGLRRKALTLASVIAFIALVVGALFGDRGILNLMNQRQRVERLGQEVESLRAENGRLAAEIAALRQEPRAIEQLAREQLGLSRPGEIVFVLPRDEAADR